MPRLLILVPTASYRAGAFVRAAQRLEVDITMASEKPNSLSQYHPIDLVTLNFDDPQKSAAAMKAFAESHPIAAVIGVDDQVTIAASAIAAQLKLPHNPVESAYTTRNKLEMRRRLSNAGVSVPRFEAISVTDDPQLTADATDYPVVLKPLMMAASRGVIRVNTPDDFVAAFNKISEIIVASDAPHDSVSRNSILVEQYVPGWEVAVEGILTNGRLNVFAIFDKPDPLEGPYFPEAIYVTPSRLPRATQTAIEAMTQAAVDAIGLRHGPIHAEIRGTDNHLWFIEMAARSIGGYCSKVLRFEGESSLEDVIVHHALDHEFSLPDRLQEAAGVMMLQAPRSGRFKEALGLDDARGTPDVDEIIISSHEGQILTPLPEGFLYLGFIFARADSPQKVEAALRAAYNKLEFLIETP